MIRDLASRVQRIQPSPTLAVSARADELKAAGKNIISLSVGEPDFDTPEHIKQAAIQAIHDGHTKYTAVDGILSLKKAIINKFSKDNDLKYDLSQILVSCGGKHSLFNLFAATLNAGDEVIIPAPYWVSYPDMVKLVDGTPVIIHADLEQNFKITPAQLKETLTPQTRLVILNSPSNPTGVSYTANELKALAKVLLDYPNALIVSDDLYEHSYWGKEPFANILMVCPELYDRCIVVNGVSKSYAMTGWRIGYAAGPAKIIAAMKKIQSQSTSNPASISQYAALAAITGDQSCIKTMNKAFKERHDYIVSELNKIPGLKAIPSDGTFYTFPCIKEAIKKSKTFNDDIGFAEYLLTEAELAVIPGSAFGAPGYMRLSYATSMENLQEAVKRMKAAIAKL